jgi:hypothetical protein
MQLELRHELACSGTTYFEKCILVEEFSRRLYADVLGFPKFELLEQKEDGDRVHRKVRIEPPLTGLAGPVKKVIGDRMSYVEEGTYDRKTGKYTFKVTPSTMPEKVKTVGEIWCEDKGENRCVRVAKITVEVKVMLVGAMIEEKIASDLRKSYDAAAAFTDAYVREKGHSA